MERRGRRGGAEDAEADHRIRSVEAAEAMNPEELRGALVIGAALLLYRFLRRRIG